MKKGFTLIELLAVIVILAIIALIATPIILGVIDKAKIGSVEQSANGYIDAIENYVVESQLTGENIIDNGVYDLPISGVEVKGQEPTSGWVKIENGIVTDYSMKIGEYTVTKGTTTVKNGEVKEKPDLATKVYENGTAIYYNPVSGRVCTYYEESNSLNENKTGCMKWYTFNDSEGSTTVNMILDHNTTAADVGWNLHNGTNIAYEESDIKPAVDKLVSGSGWVDTPRLISIEEIATITGYPNWNNNFYFFHDNSEASFEYVEGGSDLHAVGTNNYAWLFDYTRGCTKYGCNIEDSSAGGYWTGTIYSGDSESAWIVTKMGYVQTQIVNQYPSPGIRPVITISKDILSKKPETEPETETPKISENGTVIYYNPETNTKCNKLESVSTTGTKTGCMKWYTFNYDGGNMVNMILDHNTTAKVAWATSGSNASGPVEVKTQLKSDTSTWNSSLNARLIEANEIAKITGYENWNQNHYYFHDNATTYFLGNAGTNNYAWLFDNTYDCNHRGCNVVAYDTYGYWTGTSTSGDSRTAWYVSNYGRLYNGYLVSAASYYGVRPVITVSKDVIS